ncbi:MAG TPA: helix-turn-helix transcriptional regulator [Stellaceae bacterium]|nr:helix-turn-helix transcriptional regulator [Stellaceae bacterium]
MRPDELRSLRKRLGLTQAQLAEALDMSRDQIVRFEGGRSPIPRVVALAAASLAASPPH